MYSEKHILILKCDTMVKKKKKKKNPAGLLSGIMLNL